MSATMVTLGGILLIALIVWWFWFSAPQPARIAGNRTIDILVKDGIYQPAAIEVPAGQPLMLRFVRHDATPCAEKVVFGDLNIVADLPLGKPKIVNLRPLPPGTYEFACQMGMYRGRLVAKP